MNPIKDIMACLIAGLVVSGEDPGTAKCSVRKYMGEYNAAGIHV